ncbi:MAG: hypothetical protein HQK54_08700 [Oligoflexales bacterium]|nr:hypothetical protein [Oligoflexales bacterium]
MKSNSVQSALSVGSRFLFFTVMVLGLGIVGCDEEKEKSGIDGGTLKEQPAATHAASQPGEKADEPVLKDQPEKDRCMYMSGMASAASATADGTTMYEGGGISIQGCDSGNVYDINHTVNPSTDEIMGLSCRINGKVTKEVKSDKPVKIDDEPTLCGFNVEVVKPQPAAASSKDRCRLASGVGSSASMTQDGSTFYAGGGFKWEECDSGSVYETVHTVNPKTDEITAIACLIDGIPTKEVKVTSSVNMDNEAELCGFNLVLVR